MTPVQFTFILMTDEPRQSKSGSLCPSTSHHQLHEFNTSKRMNVRLDWQFFQWWHFYTSQDFVTTTIHDTRWCCSNAYRWMQHLCNKTLCDQCEDQPGCSHDRSYRGSILLATWYIVTVLFVFTSIFKEFDRHHRYTSHTTLDNRQWQKGM